MTYYTCISCLKAISEKTLAAVDKSSPFITCCDCISQKCPYGDCDYKYPDLHACKIMEIPYEHRYDVHKHPKNQCHHSLLCTKKSTDVFCDEHTCHYSNEHTQRCKYESIPGNPYCPMHKLIIHKMRDVKEMQMSRGIDKYFPIKKTYHTRDLCTRFDNVFDENLDKTTDPHDAILPNCDFASRAAKAVPEAIPPRCGMSRGMAASLAAKAALRGMVSSRNSSKDCAPSFDIAPRKY